MKRKQVREITLRSLVMAAMPIVVLVTVFGPAWQAHAQNAKAPYPSMAAIDRYLMDRNDEISLARSAAPESISRDAEVLVLGRRGYEAAVQGKNGFVCIVERSWSAGIDDPDFWNSKVRGAICFNPAGARSQIPLTLKKTELVLAGRSAAQMAEGIKAAFDRKELATPEPGAMCYMLSKQAYLSDRDGHWHPHLMFFVTQADTTTWGANLPGSPILGVKDALDRLTLFLIPVGKWSDGTTDPMDGH
jgi:hypothetical protein